MAGRVQGADLQCSAVPTVHLLVDAGDGAVLVEVSLQVIVSHVIGQAGVAVGLLTETEGVVGGVGRWV